MALLPQPMIWPVPIYATDVGISPHCRRMFFDTYNQNENKLNTPAHSYSFSALIFRHLKTVLLHRTTSYINLFSWILAFSGTLVWELQVSQL
jgi:hypothetical protein